MSEPEPEQEGRYYLQFTHFWLLPHTNNYAERLQQIGPFTCPKAARECWRNVYASREGHINPHVVYKEFDI